MVISVCFIPKNPTSSSFHRSAGSIYEFPRMNFSTPRPIICLNEQTHPLCDSYLIQTPDMQLLRNSVRCVRWLFLFWLVCFIY